MRRASLRKKPVVAKRQAAAMVEEEEEVDDEDDDDEEEEEIFGTPQERTCSLPRQMYYSDGKEKSCVASGGEAPCGRAG